MRAVGPQMCVQYKIRSCYIYVRIRIQSRGDSALHGHTVIYPAEMKKRGGFSQNLTWEYALSALAVRDGHFTVHQIDTCVLNNIVEILLS